MLRSIIDDEDQLERISELQTQFFSELNGDSASIKEHLKAKDEQALQDDEKVSPHFDRVKQALKEITNQRDK